MTPDNEQAATMLDTLSPDARRAVYALLAAGVNDSNLLISALVEASCVAAMAVGCAPDDFAAGVKKTWDERAEAFSALFPSDDTRH